MVVDPNESIQISVEPGQEIVEVTPPAGSVVEVRDGSFTFTPKPGVSGRQEISVVYLDRDGQRSSTTLIVNVRPKAAQTLLPATLRLGTNVVVIDAARATVRVSCAPLLRVKSAGDVRLCTTRSVGDRTIVTINAPAKVTLGVVQATGSGSSLIDSGTYVVRR